MLSTGRRQLEPGARPLEARGMMMRLSTLCLHLVYTSLLLLDADNMLDSARSVATQAPVPEPNRKLLSLRLTRPEECRIPSQSQKPQNLRVKI